MVSAALPLEEPTSESIAEDVVEDGLVEVTLPGLPHGADLTWAHRKVSPYTPIADVLFLGLLGVLSGPPGPQSPGRARARKPSASGAA